MGTYIVRRLLWMIPTLVGITILTFSIMQLAPGDPASMKFADPGGTGGKSEGLDIDSAVVKFRKKFLLDQPVWKQYFHYVGPFDLSEQGHTWFGGDGTRPWGGLVLLDFKTEIHEPTKQIRTELWERLKVTVPLSLISVLLSYLIALPLGIHSAVKQGTIGDGVTSVTVFLLYSIPTFWAALMLQLVFGGNLLGWLPILGLHDKDAAQLGEYSWAWWWDLAKHCILPITCMTYGAFAYLSRQMRAGMIETIRQDYIRTARAKGLSERVVVFKHALRNSLIPVVTLFASVLPILIGGSVIVEMVFDIPGMGRYAYEGLISRDYFIVMATTFISAVMTLLGILLSDITYSLVDPRISYD